MSSRTGKAVVIKAFLKAMRGEFKLMKQQARMMDMFQDDVPF